MSVIIIPKFPCSRWIPFFSIEKSQNIIGIIQFVWFSGQILWKNLKNHIICHLPGIRHVAKRRFFAWVNIYPWHCSRSPELTIWPAEPSFKVTCLAKVHRHFPIPIDFDKNQYIIPLLYRTPVIETQFGLYWLNALSQEALLNQDPLWSPFLTDHYKYWQIKY